MSATGRGDERREADFYPTPAATPRLILSRLPLGGMILEPTAGDGAIVRVLLDASVSPGRIRAVEIDPARAIITGSGTDMAAYAWFLWNSDRAGRWGYLDRAVTP